MANQIHVFRTVEASRATVFDAWVSPRTLVAPVTKVDMDAVVGGSIRISTGGDAADDLQGVFVHVDYPNRLQYTWRWGSSAEETFIDVTFHAAGRQTVVAVEHRGFLDEASATTHLDGWVSYLDGLIAGL